MQKIWLKNYPKSVPAEINPDQYQSLSEIFAESCKRFAAKPAFYSLGTTLSYQQIEKLVYSFAAYLQQSLNLKKGDRIAIMLPNTLQYPIVMWGALLAGLTVVNVNPLYTAHEFIHQIKDAGAETLVVMSNFADTVQKALPETPLKNIIVTQLGDLFPLPKAFLINFMLKYVKHKIPHWDIPQATKFNDVLSQGKQLTFKPVSVHHDDIAFLQYTGGTTGVAKGAMLTHRNIIANILQVDAWMSDLLEPGQEIMITALPLYHVFSLLGNAMLVMRIGGLNVLIVDPRDIRQLISVMDRLKFTLITGVNTLFNALLNHPHFHQLDFKGLKLSLGGGAAVQRAVAERWKAVTGCTLLEAYGLTEASPAVAINPTSLKAYNSSIGFPLSSTDIRILDDAGHDLGINQSGELAVQGPQVMVGYWHNKAETDKVLLSGQWLLTGDIASMDDQGYLRLLERKKDMIIVSGFNVYPNEVEDDLMKLPGIVEVAVVGVPDEKSGEVPKAFIVKNNPDLTAADIIKYCHTVMTGYKIPKSIEFRQELPKSNVGKILRRALRESVNE